MPAGIVTATVTVAGGPSTELDFYVDDTEAPTQWFALAETEPPSGSEFLPHFTLLRL